METSSNSAWISAGVRRMPGLSGRGLCKEGQDVAGYRTNRQERVLEVRVGRGWPKRFLIPSRREAPYRGAKFCRQGLSGVVIYPLTHCN